MNERTIKLTLTEDHNGREPYKQTFLITINDETGAEIRYARGPVVNRDTAVDVNIGMEPMHSSIRLSVEEA